ncbi:MAG: hypothetical protein WCA77_10305 [Thermoplasmata archaeon]
MPPTPLNDLHAIAARGAPEGAVPDPGLDRAVEQYLARRADPLARLITSVDGRPPSSVVEELARDQAKFETLTVSLADAPPPGPRWDYLLPFRRITISADGSAEIVLAGDSVDGTSQRAIARFMFRDRFVPRVTSAAWVTKEGETGQHPGLGTLAQSAKFVRRTSIVPLSIVTLLYLPDRRVRFEVDLVDNALLPDVRAGRLPLGRYVPRTARISHGFDAFLARGELSTPASRLLEVLVESHGLSANEVANIVGGIPEMANSALELLRARRLALFDSTQGVYRARLDAFLSASRGSSREPLPPMANPALRTSVSELLAAADSRATCPLCGDALPVGPRGILCAKCAAEVGSETSA